MFQVMVDEVLTDMADQLQWLRAREAGGEHAPIPEALK
jgi:hypothetical protein